MTNRYRRGIAVHSAWALLRRSGADPLKCTVSEAWDVLSELRHTQPDHVAVEFVLSADDAQEKLFERDWRALLRERSKTW